MSAGRSQRPGPRPGPRGNRDPRGPRGQGARRRDRPCAVGLVQTAFGLLLAAVAPLAGCADTRSYSGRLFAAGGDRGVIALADADGVTRIRSGRGASATTGEPGDAEEVRVAFAPGSDGAEAVEGADRLYLLGAGDRAILFGTRANIAFDWWGHAGSHVSASLVVDFVTRTVHPATEALPEVAALGSARRGTLELYQAPRSPRVVAWRSSYGVESIEVIDLHAHRVATIDVTDRAGPRTTKPEALAVAESGDGRLVVVTVHFRPGDGPQPKAILRWQRFATSAWPPAPIDQRDLALPADTASVDGVALSPAGTHAAWYGRRKRAGRDPLDFGASGEGSVLGVIDLERGAPLFALASPDAGFSVRAVDLRPDLGGVLVHDWVHVPDRAGFEGLVRWVDLAGRERSRRRFSSSADVVAIDAAGAAYWYASYGEAERVPLER